jgi:TPR repeat protein
LIELLNSEPNDSSNPLGVAYSNGNGVSVNKVEGLKWIKLAAENGFPKAIAFLRFHHELVALRLTFPPSFTRSLPC